MNFLGPEFNSTCQFSHPFPTFKRYNVKGPKYVKTGRGTEKACSRLRTCDLRSRDVEDVAFAETEFVLLRRLVGVKGFEDADQPWFAGFRWRTHRDLASS